MPNDTLAQATVILVIAASMLAFLHGRWRHDAIALAALLTLVVTGVVPATTAFAGFAHPAVVTVAAVLVISRALINSGLIDRLAAVLGRLGNNLHVQRIALTLLVTLCSGFMNNVGALAILMPIALQVARRVGQPASQFLMPMAFGSLLGGLMTSIGTPANLIVANFRSRAGGEPFALFDFLPVGAGVAAAGLLFMWTVGWRLLPVRKGENDEPLFELDEYLTELRVPEGNAFVERSIGELEDAADAEVLIVGLVRGTRRAPAPGRRELLRAGDVLIVEADAESLKALLDATKLEMPTEPGSKMAPLHSEEVVVLEAVVGPDSRLVGRTANELNLRRRHALNILGISRQGAQLTRRLSRISFRAGDVLLLQLEEDAQAELLTRFGLLPLATRDLRLGNPQRMLSAVAVFGMAILATAFGWLPIEIALVAAALVMVASRMLNGREVYDSIDFPIIVLLAAFIQVGTALETSGAAAAIADSLLRLEAWLSPPAIMVLLLLVTMTLSDVVNNAAAAALMAPIGITLADGLGVSPDPMLMAIALGASAAFLTPIGHQSNTLVMGPGGYAFGDYWRLGLPLSLVYAVVGIVLVLLVWPL